MSKKKQKSVKIKKEQNRELESKKKVKIKKLIKMNNQKLPKVKNIKNLKKAKKSGKEKSERTNVKVTDGKFRTSVTLDGQNAEFLNIGMKGFDDLFEKDYGVPESSSILVEGGPGSGKTIFCLAVANELCRQGKKCLYMSFEEPEENLIKHMELFNWPAEKYVKNGTLRIKRFDAIDVSRSVEALLSAAKKELLIEIDPVLFPTDFKPDFVVVDSLTSISSAFSGQQNRFRIYMEQLFRYLEKNKMTTFLIREVATPTHVGSNYKEEGEAVSFLSDGIIVMYNVIHDSGTREMAMEILKMRGSSFKKKIVKFEILSKKGFVISPDKILKKENGGFQLT